MVEASAEWRRAGDPRTIDSVHDFFLSCAPPAEVAEGDEGAVVEDAMVEKPAGNPTGYWCSVTLFLRLAGRLPGALLVP